MRKKLRIMSLTFALIFIFQYMPYFKDVYEGIGAFAQEISETSAISESEQKNETDDSSDTEKDISDSDVVNSEFAFPEKMKAVTITPGKDFFTDPSQSSDKTMEEIKGIINYLNSIDMNTIFIDTNYQGNSYYSLGPDMTNEEIAVKELVNYAKDNYFYVYVNFNINFIMDDNPDADLEYRINYLTQIAHRFAGNYFIDGIVLDGYYSTRDVSNYRYYVKDGSGIGFNNWLLDNGAYVFSLVSESIKKTDSNVPVGICISDVWANKETEESGSDTSSSFQALTDGYSDTVNYINNGYADFMVVKPQGAIDDPDISFNTVMSWWSGIAVSADIPMFVCHMNDKMETSATGWASPDQVVKQLIALEKVPNYKGSGFNSYSDLLSHKESTNVMVDYYKGQINQDALMQELVMNTPTKTDFTTTELSVKFQGTFDQNFSVTLNGEPITINEAGYFYFDEPLDVGYNTFVFQSKAKKVTYKIYRDIQVIKSVEPASTMTVEGGTSVHITANCYKGSTVTASINGKYITLTESDTIMEDGDINSSYVRFNGSYTVPKGIVNKEQDLGNIVVTGNYKNIKTENMQGGHIIVNALPEEAVEKGIIQILYDNTPTYDYNSTQTYTVPYCTRLPAGTIDYALKTVTYNGVKFYLTESGKRIKASDATLVNGYSVVNNKLSVVDTYIDSGDTVIKIALDEKTPFSISYNNISYYKRSSESYLNVHSFNSTSVYVDFDYVASVSGVPSFPSSSIFSSAQWTTVNSGTKTKQRLVLNLARAGIYSGVTARYSNGYLLLKFNDYSSNLSGKIIVVDPGHGITTSSGTFDHGFVGYVTEQSVVYPVAQKLTAALQARGATVYMLPTATQYYPRKQRPDVAINNHADMYISIHCNGVSYSNSVKGTEVHYFTEFSQPLAQSIVDNLAYAWKNQIYGDGVDRNRGTWWNWFDVTLMQDFPSVLIELGFVSNYDEAMALAKSGNQDVLVNAIVNGVSQYYSR